MTRYVVSRYTTIIKLRSGRAVAYNACSGALAVWEVEDGAVLENIRACAVESAPAKIVQALDYGGFIVREDVDELEHLEKKYKAHRFASDTAILSIVPTLACNFSCDYCFQGRDKPNGTMSEAVQDAIVGKVAQASPKLRRLGIAWYGGEPLAELAIIESLSDRLLAVCKKRGVSYTASLVTNGYLLDVKAARSLQRRGVTWVQITLDGTPEHHDSRRHLAGGQGSFRRILDNLRAIVDEVPIKYAIRVNIDERNGHDIPALIDLLVDAKLGGRKNLRVYFAAVEAITESCRAIQSETMGKASYSQMEADLQRLACRVGLGAAPYPPRFFGTCAAVRPGGFVVLPNGDLHKCWDTVAAAGEKIGSIHEMARIADDPSMMKWLRWSPFAIAACRACKLLPNCAGACAYKFMHAERTRGEVARLPCPSWKYTFTRRLLQAAVALGGIKEDELDPSVGRVDPEEVRRDLHLHLAGARSKGPGRVVYSE